MMMISMIERKAWAAEATSKSTVIWTTIGIPFNQYDPRAIRGERKRAKREEIVFNSERAQP